MAATAEVTATNAAAEQGTAAPTPKLAPVAAPESKPEAKEKPKAKPEPVAAQPANDRQSTITKFAKAMNATAEKEGVAVDAPPEERRAKPGPKPGSKRAEPKPEAASETPAPKAAPRLVISDEDTEAPDANAEPAPAAELDEDADTGRPEPRAAHQLKAKARLRHGDVDKAIKIAFGDLRPEEFEATKEALVRKLEPTSKKWAEVRRYEHEERAKSKQLETNAVQLSQRLQADFGPMIEARKAFKAGDYPKAFELAFEGAEITEFSRKAIHQKLNADPEKVRMQQKIEELERIVKAPAAQQQEQPQVTQQQAQQAALQREAQRTHKLLTEQTDDPEIAHFAQKGLFIKRVVELRGEHYDPQSNTTISLRDAAEMARDEKKRELEEWRYDDASGAAAPSSESPGLAGNEPVRTSAPRARSPLPSQAAQAGGSTRSMTRQERIAAFANRMG